MASKRERLIEVADRRRLANWHGYAQVADFHGGRYDSEFVSPYTKGAKNLDAEVMLLLQDWSSSDFLRRKFDADVAELGRRPSLPTNRNLERILQAQLGIGIENTFGTNLFPFIKQAGLSAGIPERDLVEAAKHFAIPQIEIIRPRVVVCLGFNTFRAMELALGREPSGSLASAIDNPLSVDSVPVWCQSHPGGMGRANRNRGGVDRVSDDWARMLRAVGLSAAPV